MNASKQTRREATQLFRQCMVTGLLDEERGRQMVQQIVASKPRGYMGILTYFRRLVKLDRARHTAKVESAVPLPADVKAGVENDLAHQYGEGLRTSFAENPTLIGGMRIQVGSDVYDASVRSRLVALEESF